MRTPTRPLSQQALFLEEPYLLDTCAQIYVLDHLNDDAQGRDQCELYMVTYASKCNGSMQQSVFHAREYMDCCM